MKLRLSRRGDERPTCPFCKQALERVEATLACSKCATEHHADCARELRGCTVLGCGGELSRPAAAALAAASVAAPVASASSGSGCLAVAEALLGLLQLLGFVVDLISLLAAIF